MKQPMTSAAMAGIRAREIVDADVTAVAELLGRGLGYSTQFYAQVLDRLSRHDTPAGFPKYGFLLESGGTVVGAVLMIFSTIGSAEGSTVRCHVTSWYVEPSFRCFATLFFAKALKRENVTYINISARPTALKLIQAQRFTKYSSGQFLALPILHSLAPSRPIDCEIIPGDRIPNAHFEPFERDLLRVHAEYGCITAWCVASGRAYPFVFHRRWFKGILPGAQLVYCRDQKDVVRFARPLGLFLAAQGIILVRLDSNGPIAGLIGKYWDGMDPRYYKGQRPRLGDLAFTQQVMIPEEKRLLWREQASHRRAGLRPRL